MLAALRFRGYHLFANAITTTDIHYDIINGGNFTFFAPTDSALYALDMSMSAADYTMALRFHGVPLRLSLPDLRMLSFGSNSFPTLVRGHEIHIVNPMPFPLPIMVEGVDVAYPGLFYDTHIAVHGLEGMIDFRSVLDSRNSSSNLKDEVTLDSTSDQPYQSIDTADHTPITGQHEIYAPSSQIADPVAAPPLQSSVTGIDTAAASPVSVLPETAFVPSSDVSPAHRVSVPVAPRHRQPETYSESITQPHEEHMSISTKSDLNSQELHDSITQPREEHISTAMSGSIFPRIHDVSLATKSSSKAAEEFTQVDEKIIDCAIAGDDGEQLNIANIRDGDLYMRELYTPTKMTCANE